MANVKALIDAHITANGVRSITGPVLNGVLKAMVDASRPFFVVTNGSGGITNADFSGNYIAKIEVNGVSIMEGDGFTKGLADTSVTFSPGVSLPPNTKALITYRL